MRPRHYSSLLPFTLQLYVQLRRYSYLLPFTFQLYVQLRRYSSLPPFTLQLYVQLRRYSFLLSFTLNYMSQDITAPCYPLSCSYMCSSDITAPCYSSLKQLTNPLINHQEEQHGQILSLGITIEARISTHTLTVIQPLNTATSNLFVPDCCLMPTLINFQALHYELVVFVVGEQESR